MIRVCLIELTGCAQREKTFVFSPLANLATLRDPNSTQRN